MGAFHAGPARAGPGRHRRGSRWPGRAAAGVPWIPAVLFVGVLAVGAGPASWSVPGSGSPPSYDSGQFSAVFPAPSPGVELLQDANTSVAAQLYVDHVVELQPGVSDHPLVVQVASPTSSTPFNGTYQGDGTAAFALSLHGTVPVVRTGVPLWTTPLGLPPNVTGPGLLPVTGGATLSVAYTLARSGDGSTGLELTFNVHDWPWLAPTDLLGVELRFVDEAAVGFDACGPAPALASSPDAGCEGTVLDPGSILWNSTAMRSVVARDPAGFAAAFVWSPTAQLAPDAATPLTAGAFYASANTTRVLLAAAGGGSANVTTSAQMLIAVPPSVLPGTVLHGDLGAYGLAFAVSGAFALAGLALYRRRERRLRADL